MSPDADGYAFLDCGDGRRLERMGGIVVARPAPAAIWRRRLPDAAWNAADLSFDRRSGWRGTAPDGWRMRLGGVVMALRPAAAGQVGAFPEHAAVAVKILSLPFPEERPIRALNLFAHTGLTTLMLAASPLPFETAHVDGAPASVKQARENAALSGLADRPVRWLADDALGFMRREVRREKRYDVVVADPPAFGRGGKKGGEWKLDRDLPTLLGLARELLREGGTLAVTCHSEGWEDGRLSEAVRDYAGARNVAEEPLALRPEAGGGAALPCGRLALTRLDR